jgi:crotonobetainyl-CoA:carnitine CoA-transferase CaiB-like acyl-CoA transferase
MQSFNHTCQLSCRTPNLWVQQCDEGALEELVAIERKIVGHPRHARGRQARPAQQQPCTSSLSIQSALVKEKACGVPVGCLLQPNKVTSWRQTAAQLAAKNTAGHAAQQLR